MQWCRNHVSFYKNRNYEIILLLACIDTIFHTRIDWITKSRTSSEPRWSSMVAMNACIRANGVQARPPKAALQRLRSSGNICPVIGKFAKKSECVGFNVLNNAFPRRLRFATFFIMLTSNAHRSSRSNFGRARGFATFVSARGSSCGHTTSSTMIQPVPVLRRGHDHDNRWSIAEVDGRAEH